MSPISLPARHTIVERIRWRLVATCRDSLLVALSAVLAFELRFDGALPAKYFHSLAISLCVWTGAKTIVFALCALNHAYWKYTSLFDATRIALANSVGSVLGGVIIVVALGSGSIPRSVYVLEWVISTFVLLSARAVIRILTMSKSNPLAEGRGTKTLIYGAGAAGLQLLGELRQNRSLMCDVIGFIDDDPSKVGLMLDGKRVLGTGEALAALAEKLAATRLLIAIPSATGPQMVRILKLAIDAEVEYKMVPSLGDLIQGKTLRRQIRNIAVEDLLGRQSVQLNQEHIRSRIQGKVVMVTGAAGSIGSELCRQIAHFSPLALVGFDEAETPLFDLDRELRNNFPSLRFHPEIGNVTSPEHLPRVMEYYQPSLLYHAAAYKHVPLMEKQVFPAVENNVFGTWQTALAAVKYGVEEFVMISTDKAVRPTSIMGATKRIAELAIRTLQMESDTKFSAVRFGNVLGSNGSVVPIFKEQIAAGGPVTVTHPEMRRYFMTIPEAAQLVLQAISMGKGGDVFLLDMGEPVKIVDLARNLIMLSGLKPDRDIKIEFTGPRPGEKLMEELNFCDESVQPTSHPKIRRYACPAGTDITQLRAHLRDLRQIVDDRDVIRLVLLFKDLIPDYNPSAELLKAALLSNSVTPDPLRFEFTVREDKNLAVMSLGSAPEIS